MNTLELKLLHCQSEDVRIDAFPTASTAGMYQDNGPVEWDPYTFKMEISPVQKIGGDLHPPIERAVVHSLTDRFQKPIALVHGLQFRAKG
jgi:hypothetical protein